MADILTHTLSGAQTIYGVVALQREILGLLEGACGLVLDCSQVSSCDTAFLQLLSALSSTCAKRRLPFSLVAGTALREAALLAGFDLQDACFSVRKDD